MSGTPDKQVEKLVAATITPAALPKNGLRERALRQRTRQNRLAGALIAVLTVGSLAVYLPQQRSIAATRIELANTEAELAANRDRAAMLPQLMSAVSSLRRQVDQFKPLRGSSDIERAMREISSINTSTKLANYKYVTDVQKKKALCLETALKITFEADFVDAMSFIQKLEAMDRLTRLRELTIEKREGALGGEVSVSMSLSLFFDPRSEVTK